MTKRLIAVLGLLLVFVLQLAAATPSIEGAATPADTPVPTTDAPVPATDTPPSPTDPPPASPTDVSVPTPTAAPAESSFVPAADARVEKASPGGNYGGSERLRVDGGSDPAVETYLMFSVSDISGSVTQATLRLFATSGTKDGPAAYAVASNWSETGITWSNRPGRDSGALADLGVVAPNTWVEFDVRAVVTGNGAYSFVLATGSADGLNMSSREAGDTAPQLVITTGDSSTDPVPTVEVTSTSVSGDPAIVLAAGDVTSCSSTGSRATGELIRSRQGAVLPLGDLAYSSGTADQFQNCYDPVWGGFKDRTYPAPGNHEYNTEGATGYYGYFGAAAGDPSKGYYSFDLGRWHIVALNSNCDDIGGCDAGSPQEQWLRADLTAHPAACTLAFMHFPLYSSGKHGNNPEVRPLWQALHDYDAELVLSGHDHDYERFAPQDANGNLDQNRGIRQFVVGTGGVGHYDMDEPEPNSEIQNNTTFGVLELILRPTGYDWTFLPAGDGTFTDSGSGTCHDANGPIASGDRSIAFQIPSAGLLAIWRRETVVTII